jgi:hypothetical protein
MGIWTGRKGLIPFGRRLARDERGAALVYVSIALTVFMGFAALVIDGSRLFTLDTEMQSAADALALAGAAELDGNSDAITRATAAMDNLVANYETFGDSGTPITGYAARFLDSLPASDADEITEEYETDDPTEARFVEVRLLQEEGEGGAEGEDNTRSISTMFASAIGGADTARAGAVAVAGFTAAVCKFTPLFMCNPFEETDPSLGYFTSQMSTQAGKRRIIALKKSGNGASYTPGNFGFLESELGHGANALGEALARVDPGTCYRQDGVETKTGSTNSVHRDINVRFDLYDNGVPGSWKNSADYRPAQNVTKGYVLSGGNGNGNGNGGGGASAWCNAGLDASDPPKAMGFPLDSVIDHAGTRLGNGEWDVAAYWNINHPGISYPPAEHPEWGTTNENRPSRYEVYRWEIEEGHIPDNSATGGENGNAQCNRNGVSDEVDRRIIYAAVLNCTELGLTGGSGGTVPALTFVKMFMTQPMTKLPGTGHTDEDDTLYVEMVDIVKPGTADEVVHDIVQLYR